MVTRIEPKSPCGFVNQDTWATTELISLFLSFCREVSTEMCEVIIEQSVEKKCSDVEQKEFREEANSMSSLTSFLSTNQQKY